MSGNTIKKALKEDGIQQRKPSIKPNISNEQKAARLSFCLRYRYRYLDWRYVIFTDESYFETGNFVEEEREGFYDDQERHFCHVMWVENLVLE